MLQKTYDFLHKDLETLSREDITELRDIITFHRYQYYELEKPLITDDEFDKLYTLLVTWEEKFGMHHDVDTPTKEVNRLEENHFTKAPHKHPMISLDNTYNADDLVEFEKRIKRILDSDADSSRSIEYIIEYKFDGLGIALTYEKGRLVRALTRWDGIRGEDITLNALQIDNIPKNISFQWSLEVRGEVVMSRAAFEKLNAKRLTTGEKLFANPRNAASGSLRQLDPWVTRERELLFFAYSCPDLEEWMNEKWTMNNNIVNVRKITKYSDIIEELWKYWFQTSQQWQWGALFFEKKQWVQSIIDMIHEMGKKPVCPFDIDGLVIKVNSLQLWGILWVTAHHPRSAISYKFPAEYARTKIQNILHSVGRTGVITPVAQVDPVNIMGVVVKNATLHNYDEVEKKNLKIGDWVFIHRAGEVIPEIIAPIIESRDGSENPIIPPKECPVCGSKTYREGDKVALLCSNPLCPARETQGLEWFVSKHGIDIEWFWPKQIELFRELWWITDVASIYDLRDHWDELLLIEGYKQKSVENLMKAIEEKRTLSVERIIAALGIPWVGKRTAKLLAPLFHTSDDILLFKKTPEELEVIKDIWPETARSICEYFQTHTVLLQRLLERIKVVYPQTSQVSESMLAGKTFCVTGTFAVSRHKIHAMIEENGGEVRTSVSGNLDYLIVGENAGSKKSKAQSLGVTVLDWEGFKELISTI